MQGDGRLVREQSRLGAFAQARLVTPGGAGDRTSSLAVSGPNRSTP